MPRFNGTQEKMTGIYCKVKKCKVFEGSLTSLRICQKENCEHLSSNYKTKTEDRPPSPLGPCHNCGSKWWWWQQNDWNLRGGWVCNHCHPPPPI